jgi:hypothetical protein
MGCQTDVELGSNLTFTICTHDPDTGALTDADSNPTYRVYEDETATPILTGSMSLLDAANTDGFYSETIAVTAANGFEANRSYNIYIQATVDGDTGGISYGFRATVTAASNATTIADAILSRGVDNVEDTADRTSLAELLLAAFESGLSGSTWTIYKTDHATAFGTRTVTTDSNAAPITEVT